MGTNQLFAAFPLNPNGPGLPVTVTPDRSPNNPCRLDGILSTRSASKLGDPVCGSVTAPNLLSYPCQRVACLPSMVVSIRTVTQTPNSGSNTRASQRIYRPTGRQCCRRVHNRALRALPETHHPGSRCFLQFQIDGLDASEPSARFAPGLQRCGGAESIRRAPGTSLPRRESPSPFLGASTSAPVTKPGRVRSRLTVFLAALPAFFEPPEHPIPKFRLL